MIPRVAHFVYGLREQDEPLPFLHFASIESCRRVLAPERIYFHYRHLPWGVWWERICPSLTLVPVEPVEAVLQADYSRGAIPEHLRYAHHADFIRLDALIEHGGIYADIDTIFVRSFPQELFEQEFVIGRELPVRDERTGELRPSLCNALLMAQPGAVFARAWRERMAAALDGSWSNHSGFLSQELCEQMPDHVRVEPEERFFAFPASPRGVSQLLRERHEIPQEALSVHLWAHLGGNAAGETSAHAHVGWTTPSFVRSARTTLAELLRPYLERVSDPDRIAVELHLDRRRLGYGVAADRCMSALQDAGVVLDWLPYIPGSGTSTFYAPGLSAAAAAPAAGGSREHPPVVVAHIVPEYFSYVRHERPEAFLVGHTVWETDRLPRHWIPCMDAADLLIVPCRFNADVIEDSPVRTPVAVVPYVAPPPLPASPGALWEAIPEDTLVFYTIAMWMPRKGVAKTVEAFLRAFTARDRVLLIIKTSPRDYTREVSGLGGVARRGTTAWTLARLLAKHPNPPAVRLVTQELSEVELGGLHLRGDCFVSLCHSEGWGLGSFDAAAHGKPVVTTGFGGQLDYLAGSPLLVDYRARAGARRNQVGDVHARPALGGARHRARRRAAACSGEGARARTRTGRRARAGDPLALPPGGGRRGLPRVGRGRAGPRQLARGSSRDGVRTHRHAVIASRVTDRGGGLALTRERATGIDDPREEPGRARRCSLALAVAVLCVLILAPGASASFEWSAALPADVGGTFDLGLVSCPSRTQCTAVGAGQIVTFNPESPGFPVRRTVLKESFLDLESIACPTTSECVADGDSTLFVFNPNSTGAPVEDETGAFGGSLACPSESQCTLADDAGAVYTFNPGSPGSVSFHGVDAKGARAIACPTIGQCTVVDAEGGEATFNPAMPGAPTVTKVDSIDGIDSVACTSTSQCVAVDADGGESTFNPTKPATHTEAFLDVLHTLDAVQCPAEHECIATDGYEEIMFDPAAPGSPGKQAVDPTSAMYGLSCPSETECVGEDLLNGAVVFDPAKPLAKLSPVATGEFPAALACESATECTAVDENGDEVTFEPLSPGSTTAHQVAGFAAIYAISCPAATKCVAVDDESTETTFEPASPGSAKPVVIDKVDNKLVGVACPTTSECVAVDDFGAVVVFNPESPAGATRTVINETERFRAIACPSSGQCTAAGDGNEVTFDPSKPETNTKLTFANEGVESLACPTTSQCTATTNASDAITFDPGEPGPVIESAIGPATSIACPSTTLCLASEQKGAMVAFDPLAPGQVRRTASGSTSQAGAVACPSTSECAIVGRNGEFVLDPQTAIYATQTAIDGLQGLRAADCVSEAQCTAVGNAGFETTFDPAAPGDPTDYTVDDTTALDAVACTSAIHCTAVDANGGEVTFDPEAPGEPTRSTIDSPYVSLNGVSCPLANQCVAVGSSGSEVTFNPASPGAAKASTVDGETTLEAVSCPSSTQCTAVDAGGTELTFSPASPGAAVSATIDNGDGNTGSAALDAIDCLSSTLCVAIDAGGAKLAFNPQSPGSPAREELETLFTAPQSVSVSCPSASLCVALGESLPLFEGEPSAAWSKPERSVGAGVITCASVSQCLIVNRSGYAYVGTPVPVKEKEPEEQQEPGKQKEPEQQTLAEKQQAPAKRKEVLPAEVLTSLGSPQTPAVDIAKTPHAVEEVVLACTREPLVLNDVLIEGSHVLLAGSAERSLHGRTVKIVFTGGHVVASARVQSDGLFTTTAPLPAASIRETNSARYMAEYGHLRSLNLKLTRRLQLQPPRVSGRTVTLIGEVVPPLTEPAPQIVVQQQLRCGRSIVVGYATPGTSGRFRITLSVPRSARAGTYRLTSTVLATASSSQGFSTYSLPLPAVF